MRILVPLSEEDHGYILTNNVVTYVYPKYETLDDSEFVKMKFSLAIMRDVHKAKKFALIDEKEIFKDKDGNTMYNWKDSLAPFREAFGDIVPIAGNRMVALDSIFMLNAYLKYKQPKKKTGKKQKRIDELISYKIPPAGKTPKKLPEIKKSYGWQAKNNAPMYDNLQKYAVVQRVKCDEPMCVVRTFFRSQTFDKIQEGGRIYIGKEEVIACRMTKDGEFIYQPLSDNPFNWNFYIRNFREEVGYGTKLEYFSSVVKEISPENRGLAIWSFIRYPITEQMYKINLFKPIMQEVFALSSCASPITVLEAIFGPIDRNASNIFKAIGMNKQQVELLMPDMLRYMPMFSPYNIYYYGLIYHIKKVFAEDRLMIWRDISNVDIETVKFVAEAIISVDDEGLSTRIRRQGDWYELHRKYYDFVQREDTAASILQITRRVYGNAAMKKTFYKVMSLFNQSAEYQHPGYNWMCRATYQILYCDYVNMVEQLGMQSRMKPYFDTGEQLVSMHETAAELLNVKRVEIEQQRWNKMTEKKKWSKWEFEDDDFAVVAPSQPEDLATEGITLHHCVKSYISKVAAGDTNIMFIRKKEDLNKPFFTVEVSNDGNIEQVHGACNCNADTCPGLENFVSKWAKKRNLKAHGYNKVR